jgi:hypothetical protein
MLTTLPVNRQDDFPGRPVHVSNNIDDQGTNQLLAHAHGDARCIPGSSEVLGKLRKVRGGDSCRWRAHRLQARLAGLYAAQCCFPILLQLRGNQTVVGIAGGVTPLGQRGIVLSLLQFELYDAPLLVQSIHVRLLGLLGCLDGHWLHDTQEFFADSGVYARAAETHASRRHVKAVTSVDRLRYAPSIGHRQAASTARACQQAGKQCPSAPARFYVARLAVGIGREQLLVSLEFRPVDVAFVVLSEQDVPFLKRLTVLVALARAAIHYRHLLAALAIYVGTGIERILEHRDNVSVAYRYPVEVSQRPAVRGAREVNLFSPQRQQNLPCAAQFPETGEDQAYDFLQPQVWIETQADITMPDIADRHADTQFATVRLVAFGIEHACTKHVELEFTDAAFHTEQQPVVCPTWIVHTV